MKVNLIKKRATYILLLLFISALLTGCGANSTSTMTTSTAMPPAMTSSAASPSPSSEPSPSPSPSPTLTKTDSRVLQWPSENGYTETIEMSVWDPVFILTQSGISHPNDVSFTLADFDSAKDIAVPVEYRFTNATQGFSMDLCLSMFLAIVQKPHEEAFFNDINYAEGMTFEQVLNINGGTSNEYYCGDSLNMHSTEYVASYTHSSVASNDTIIVDGFVVIHNYYTPLHPSGNDAILSQIFITPFPNNSDGITLSGLDVVNYGR